MGSVGFVDPATAPYYDAVVPEDRRDKLQVQTEEPIRVSECFGQARQDEPGPQGFLVRFPAGSIGHAHFHPVDQYQLFFGSDGSWYQRTDVGAGDVMVHYTDAYSVYGPFGSRGPQPLEFFTLRARSTVVTGFLPEARDQLIHRGRRNYHTTVGAHLGTAPARSAPIVPVLEPEPDGLAAHLVAAGPGAPVPPVALDPPAVGEYHCVIEGSVHDGATTWPARSLRWRDVGEPSPDLPAGDADCRVLVLQYPHPTAPPPER